MQILLMGDSIGNAVFHCLNNQGAGATFVGESGATFEKVQSLFYKRHFHKRCEQGLVLLVIFCGHNDAGHALQMEVGAFIDGLRKSSNNNKFLHIYLVPPVAWSEDGQRPNSAVVDMMQSYTSWMKHVSKTNVVPLEDVDDRITIEPRGLYVAGADLFNKSGKHFVDEVNWKLARHVKSIADAALGEFQRDTEAALKAKAEAEMKTALAEAEAKMQAALAEAEAEKEEMKTALAEAALAKAKAEAKIAEAEATLAEAGDERGDAGEVVVATAGTKRPLEDAIDAFNDADEDVKRLCKELEEAKKELAIAQQVVGEFREEAREVLATTDDVATPWSEE